ncbi:hypothetical protein [Planctomonas deserti]|uniref:hypothetical protein n=1 Tax=Planctomonas deserti TaxID=2144185 RepID=UPI00131ED219|nr:hypothetical protein [Planctomonas deserti]
MTSTKVSFVPAHLALRPPRVAILVPDDHLWREWTMQAVATASEYWGGGGFILVPYDRESGDPSAVFAAIVRAYDPDHVVTLEVSLRQFAEWYPDAIQFSNVSDEAEREEAVRNMHGEVGDPAGVRARATVASWCSPLRSIPLSREEESRQIETLTELGRPNRSDPYPRGLAAAPIPARSLRLAASISWRTDIGLLAALQVGIAHEESWERPEPGAETLEWALAQQADPPASLIWNNLGERPTETAGLESWFVADQGLVRVWRGHARDGAAVVVGDTGADFALALAYDRLLGRGVWLTTALLDDQDFFEAHIMSTMWRLTSKLERAASHLVVTSTSLSPERISEAAERLQESRYGFQRTRPRNRSEARTTVQVRQANLDRGNSEYVMREHLGTTIVLPMEELEDGSRNALTGLESPVPSELLYSGDSGQAPYWYVDVTLERAHAPRARDLPAGAVVIEDGIFPEVNLRSSKDGFSYDPSSMGFVSSGTFLKGRLGKPRLRSLSTRAWVTSMAEPAGLGVRLSAPGRQAELVRQRLGSREALLDLVAGPTRAMLRAFIARDAPPRRRTPGTVVLGVDPYLSFAAIDDLVPGSSDATVDIIDNLAKARLLRRGLILGCQECGRPSFVDADRLGQQFECPQCASLNALISERWREGAEPTWYYDLFATFRELLKSNGDVPLLAAGHLRAKARKYLDTPELEFFELETNEAVAEIDVVASVDGEVVIVEAKSNGAFAARKRGAQTQKLLRIAEVLRADRLILATTAAHWNSTDIEHLSREAAALNPFPLKTEVLEELSGEQRSS